MESQIVLNKVMCFLGDRGSRKTNFATKMAYDYAKLGINVFTNIELYGIKHTTIDFKNVATFPEWLHDGVIILDEMQVGADSYNFLKGDVQAITKFITQIRKRNLSFIYITQNFSTIVKRLRQQTDFIFEFTLLQEEGYSEINVRDLKNNNEIVNKFVFDGRPFYKYYNTNQIIS